MEKLSGLLTEKLQEINSYKAPSIKNGFTQIPNSIITSADLTFNEKLVWLVMKMHQMNKTVSFASHKKNG